MCILDTKLLKFSLCWGIVFLFVLKLCGEVWVHTACIISCYQFSVFCIVIYFYSEYSLFSVFSCQSC